MIKKIIGIVLGLVISGIILFAGLVITLTVTDYKPEAIETINPTNHTDNHLSLDQAYTMTSWNIGYLGLSENEDFFMDDGSKSKPDNLEIVLDNFDGVTQTLNQTKSDFIILQEVDVNSARTYDFDEKQAFEKTFTTMNAAFAYNYKVAFVPVPFPPMGKVQAGQLSLSSYSISGATRINLPSDYGWPTQLAMLDRCIVKTEYPIMNSDKQLIVLNAHLSAYDDGSLREEQMALIKTLLESYSEKGDYVILAGDFNQTFPMIEMSQFPLYKEGTFYMPHQIEESWQIDDWQWGVDPLTPTYRLLNAPYVEGVSQTGIIDGYFVSPNIEIIRVETLDNHFEYSDHNPVLLQFKLKP